MANLIRLSSLTRVAAIATITAITQGQTYRVFDLGEVNFVANEGVPIDDRTFGINNHGEVAFWIVVNGEERAHIWLPRPAYGVAAGVHALTATHPSVAVDINDDGIVVGQQDGIVDANGLPDGEAVYWDLSNGGVTSAPVSIGTLTTGLFSRAVAVNNEDPPEITGASAVSSECNPCNPEEVSSFWRSFRFTTSLEALDSEGICRPASISRDINGSGLIVGRGTKSKFDPTSICFEAVRCQGTGNGDGFNDALSWSAPTPLDPSLVTDLGDERSSACRGLNESGQIAGWGFDPAFPQCVRRALFWVDSDSGPTNLGIVAGLGSLEGSWGEAINGNTQPTVVGWNTSLSRALRWTNTGTPITNTANWDVLQLDTGLTYLGCQDDIVAPETGDGVLIQRAYDINDDGWIVAYGLDQISDEFHAYVIADVTTLDTNPCPVDIDGSGVVDVGDLIDVLTFWGQCTCFGCDLQDCPGDTNRDCHVNVTDLVNVASLVWGTVCPGSSASPPPSLQDYVESAGLVYPDDWDLFVNNLEDANYRCWMDHYLSRSRPPKIASHNPCWGPNCPGSDPFGGH